MVQLACSPSLHPNALHCFRTKMAFHFGMTDSLRHNGLMGTRDISLRSSFAPLPETADSFWAPGEIFTSHDLLYHFILVNYIPLDHQKLFIALADACKEEGHPDLAAIYEDMECTNYTVKPLDNLPYKFINAVKFLARHTVDAKASDDLAKALRDGDTKGASARITSYQTTRDALRQKNETLALQILESLLIKPPITPVKREILHALKTQSE